MDVVVVSTNPETIDGLESYLRSAHIAGRCTSDIERCAEFVGPTTLALVVFPDDFAWEQVLATMATVAELRPTTVLILVTSNAKRFSVLVDDKVIVMPRPVWGWTLVDAIRSNEPGPPSEAR